MKEGLKKKKLREEKEEEKLGAALAECGGSATGCGKAAGDF